jgi:hypothetical protein
VKSYGFTVENNIFAQAQITVSNLSRHISPFQIELCESLCFETYKDNLVTFILDITGVSEQLMSFLSVKNLKPHLKQSINSVALGQALL